MGNLTCLSAKAVVVFLAPGARKVTQATSNECLPTAVGDYPQLPASELHKRTGANCSPLIAMVFLGSGGQSSHWASVGSGRSLLQEPKKQES